MPGLAPTLDVLNRNAFPDSRAPAALLMRGDAPDKTASEGLFDLAYAIPNARIAHKPTRSGVPVGMWRSVGHSHHAFFKEGFIDEMAHAAKADPVAFRLGLLEGLPRHQAVLRRAAELAQWGQAAVAVQPAGAAGGAKRGRGIAIHRSFGTVVAQVAEVSVSEDKKIRVHRVVCVVDCGLPVNPNLIRQQMESGIVYGLSAALHGEITIEKGRVQQSNFHDYRMLRIDQAPKIEVHVIKSGESPGGIGETGVTAGPPPLRNAIRHQRIRRELSLDGTRTRRR